MTTVACPACGATDAQPLCWKPVEDEIARPGLRPPDIPGYQIVACVGCGLARLDPLPSPDELTALYDDTYFRHAAFNGRASDALIAYRAQGGPPRLEAIRAARARAYEQAHVADIARVYDALAAVDAGRPPRFLDVGCGSGGVLAAARERGWLAVGVEPSPAAARLAARQGNVVVQAELAGAGFPDASFDIVHLREVLEHVVDPLALLREARRVLRPGGLLYVQVPNDLEGYRAAVFPRVWWLVPPYHLWYFTFDTLERLLARVGLATRVRGTLGLGVGYDTYRTLGARLGALTWLDAHEDHPRLALAPRLIRAAFRAVGAPADRALDRARRHSSLWVYSVAAERI